MKALTFEEWYKKVQIDRISSLRIFDLARQGMIPEDEAVRVDWERNKGCSGARIIYEYGDTGEVIWRGGPNGDSLCLYGNGKIEVGYWTRAPKPAWTPKVGEAVFYDGSAYVHVATVTGFYTRDSQYTILLSNGGVVDRVKICELKPFDASKIGKPWEEI